MIVRHIEFEISKDLDFTTLAESMEDFEGDTEEYQEEILDDYLSEEAYDIIKNYVKIKKVWYEEEAE